MGLSDDALQEFANKHGILATLGYILVRTFLGWEFKKIDRIEKKLDKHIESSDAHLSAIDEKLATVTERHRIEDL